MVFRSPNQESLPVLRSHSQPTALPHSIDNRKRSSLSPSSSWATLRSSTRTAKTKKGPEVQNKNNCSDKTRLMGSASVKGPRPWTAPQMDIRAMIVAEEPTPAEPKRNADQTRNGTRKYRSAGGSRLSGAKNMR